MVRRGGEVDLAHLVRERSQVAHQPAVGIGARGDELVERQREAEGPLRGVRLVVKIALDLPAPLALVDDPITGIGPKPLAPPFTPALEGPVSLGGDALVERLHRGTVGEHQPAHPPHLVGGRQVRGGERELVHALDHAVPEPAVEGASKRVQQ